MSGGEVYIRNPDGEWYVGIVNAISLKMDRVLEPSFWLEGMNLRRADFDGNDPPVFDDQEMT